MLHYVMKFPSLGHTPVPRDDDIRATTIYRCVMT